MTLLVPYTETVWYWKTQFEEIIEREKTVQYPFKNHSFVFTCYMWQVSDIGFDSRNGKYTIFLTINYLLI